VYETGAEPPPLDLVQVADRPAPDPDVPAAASRGVGHDATSAVLPAVPPPGTVTYRLRATESSGI
jgi:hypothetical protein